MKTLILILSVLVVGCVPPSSDNTVPAANSTPTTSTSTAASTPSIKSTPSPSATVSPTPSPSPSASPIPVVVYSATATLATIYGGVDNGDKIYGTGHCFVYNAKDYCWDDGLQTVTGFSVDYSYWGLEDDLVPCPNEEDLNGCSSDYFSSPQLVTTTVTNSLNEVIGSAHRSVATVLSGTSSVASCTFDSNSSILSCTDTTTGNFEATIQ